MPRVQWAGTTEMLLSKINSWRHRHKLERDPLKHIIEECSKENPKLQRSQPITTAGIWGTPLLTEQASKVFVKPFPCHLR